MNAAIQTWIDQAAATRGLVACGFQEADRSLTVKTASPELSAAQMEQIMRRLFEAVEALQKNQIPTERVRWSFETVQLFCVARPGGEVAAVLVGKEAASLGEIEHLMLQAPFKPE